MDKKTYLYLGVAGVGVILIFMSLANRGGEGGLNGGRPLGILPSPSASPVISLKPSLKSSVKPTPGVIVNIVNDYQHLAAQFDAGDRRLALDATCSALVPSQITYKNNTQVMLDNTASTEPRTLKIGDRSYGLLARGWYVTTLYSPKLPAQLTIFCGNIELGQLDLN